ncbi:hypothetical protein CHARACLAT_019074 [Characodon lateralis]|uniref:Uncharacterized protein n=1 Tax=Characodon lateralis TaxID=208331 RepID=A0ABU7E235_9TELE|nr:hypothetical protein [Characodon lateralis]
MSTGSGDRMDLAQRLVNMAVTDSRRYGAHPTLEPSPDELLQKLKSCPTQAFRTLGLITSGHAALFRFSLSSF